MQWHRNDDLLNENANQNGNRKNLINGNGNKKIVGFLKDES